MRINEYPRAISFNDGDVLLKDGSDGTKQYLSPMRLHLYLNPYLRPQCIKTSTEESISVQV